MSRVICDYCGKDFFNSVMLNMHMRSEHPKTLDSIQSLVIIT